MSGDACLYKTIDDAQKKLIAEISKLVGRDKANDFIRELSFNASQEGASINLQKLIDDLAITDDKEKQKITSQSTNFAQTLLESKIYQNIKQAEGAGTDVDTLSTKVEHKLEKIDINVSLGNNGTVNVNANGAGVNASSTVKNPNQP